MNMKNRLEVIIVEQLQSFMTSKQVCKYTGFSIGFINKAEKQGMLKPCRKMPFNNRRLYLQSDVDVFMNKLKNSEINF